MLSPLGSSQGATPAPGPVGPAAPAQILPPLPGDLWVFAPTASTKSAELTHSLTSRSGGTGQGWRPAGRATKDWLVCLAGTLVAADTGARRGEAGRGDGGPAPCDAPLHAWCFGAGLLFCSCLVVVALVWKLSFSGDGKPAPSWFLWYSNEFDAPT